MEKQELLTLAIKQNVPYRWSAGIYGGKFLTELRDNGKIYANKCPKCGFHCIYPRIACPRCSIRMEEWGKWIEVGPKGTVLLFNITEQPFLNPMTGKMLKVPMTVGLIQLDGAPVVFTHYLEETNPEKLCIGMRVEAVFKPREERKANINDILHFKTIKE